MEGVYSIFSRVGVPGVVCVRRKPAESPQAALAVQLSLVFSGFLAFGIFHYRHGTRGCSNTGGIQARPEWSNHSRQFLGLDLESVGRFGNTCTI